MEIKIGFEEVLADLAMVFFLVFLQFWWLYGCRAGLSGCLGLDVLGFAGVSCLTV